MKTINISKTIREIKSKQVEDTYIGCGDWNHALILAIQIIKDNIKDDEKTN